MNTREVGDTAGAARRMIRALGRRVGQESPEDLRLIVELRAEVEAAFLAAMRAQHEGMGYSYAEIAAGLGVSKQSVAQRLTRPSAGDAA